ncbi:AAA ATPase midasin [Podospora pseudoanserina]|uniref:Midasin n=1 Tax=Podospora pseudoanserina TaxID=2609844 RepID=A0ABR0HKY5_9PEZI|nr:AAA ATPase midasin [Podospora pseudoanserina]
MATIDVSLQRRSLLRDAATLQLLPRELVLIIQDHHTHSSQLLEAIATAALIAPATDRIFAHLDSCFADICARWVLSHPKLDVKVFASFARILPFAPALSVFLTSHIQGGGGAGGLRPGQQILDHLDLTSFSDIDLPIILLALWRLNNFDKRTYSPLSSPSQLQSLFTTHANPAVRCLAIRIFCQLHDASDQKLEALLTKYIAQDTSLIADLDGRRADYSFLSLYEDARSQEIQRLRSSIQTEQQQQQEGPVAPVIQNLTPLVVTYGKTVLPRPLGPVNTPSTLALTSTTVENLENLGRLLQKPGPVLLHGLSGAGKTSLVQEVARELGKQGEMVTLHLNEQTDAKMLLGLYTTNEKPGSFSWRPGVLTTAVREGRWVLIEDLDRAPTEVMSTLLPLIERGELLIPGRGERIQATSGFRMFATVRTLMGMNDKENLPNMIGQRLWQLLHIKALPRDDLREVIVGRYPLLHRYTVGILAVFDRLIASTSGSSRLSLGRTVLDRPIGTRDLLKWCGRLDDILRSAGVKTGEEPVTDTTRDRMFLEAVDCFVSNIHEIAARNLLIQAIAKEMHLSPERVRHYLSHYIPDMVDSESRLTIGRASFVKSRRSGRITKSKRPFATTVHAKRLLEQIAVAVKHREPLLLVGETGIGKTTVVQQLAESLGHQLVAVNLSQQSEASDLLGGFKPVSAQSLAMPIKEEFEDLLEKTGVSAEKNREYLDRIAKRFVRGKWREVSKEWRKAPKMFEAILEKLESAQTKDEPAEEQPAKRRKTGSTKLQRLRDLRPRWDTFSQSLDQFDRQVASGGAFAFAFVEGKIVKAARNGDWILLDEINLASPDTLESIAGLFQTTPSLLLSETGEIERIQAHPNFRVFGAMNPATDVGKRDLPLGLRSRFTEIYVQSPDRDKKDLLTIIKTYLKGNNSTIDRLADDVADLYLEIKQRAEAKQLVDQASEVPHFSLRTLTRVLTYANDVAPVYGLDRALYEGFCMCFTTLLSEESERTVRPLIHQHLLKKSNILTQPPKKPLDGKPYISFKNRDKTHEYFLLQGNHEPIVRDDYIITRYVERNLLNLVRATSTRRYPILIQGPTSAGKTSMIEYLANYTGNKFVRINNHEHTDLQEYLGTYVSDSEGKLRFQEGLLVQAMREGSWIVLDELNLAPTDVLEALNRLLDDNRELLIPETQEIVRPAENFCLFATQNPPGLYGGRKVLSRAFRNRFLELHFDDIPESELKEILQQRSRNTAPSDCGRIVNVYKQLTRLRQESRVFEQKNSFATLRDLFRWALRESETRQEIAEHGYMLLAERVRKPEERDEVRKVIEQEFRVTIDSAKLYDLDTAPELRNVKARNSQGVIWTRAMRRLYVLVKRAIKNNEPVLLVGETGCGKTTVVQLLAEFEGQGLHIVNAHQNTETGDLIGSQRPVRNRGAVVDALFRDLEELAGLLGRERGALEELQEWYRSLSADELARVPEALRAKIHAGITRSKALFEWSDGSLVHAMREGSYFLLDEISLADDSVLERLNSVLEPQRTLLLAEKGVDDSFVQGTEGFQFFATMNPGGDFGKKELSPALRNRFTEIWVPAFSDVEDVHDIVVSKLDKRFKQGKSTKSKPVSQIIVEFAYWFGKTFRPSSATAFSVRDILSWVQFMNTCPFKSTDLALLHGAAMVFIDTIGANPSALISVDPKEMASQRQQCLQQLGALCGKDLSQLYFQEPELEITPGALSIGDFGVERSEAAKPDAGDEFAVPTTKMNAMRVIRALQGTKPILLEGNPGVGKTTLITALARACGRPLTRINLSDQTDLMDLFGTDVPVEGAEAGNFVWQNAPFLEAMQKGEWVLLDEMNLASQTVLEGLNACLDHRGEVYIAELDQVFKRHPDFKLFAAQNPHHQGGGRKGLPSSFVNRFTVVYSDVFTKEDLLHITAKKFAKIGEDTQHRLIEFMSKLDDEVVGRRSFGALGSPWEFNLRDTLRWGDLLTSDKALLADRKPDDYLDVIIRQRFRSERDREAVNKLFAEIFERMPEQHGLYHDINPYFCQVGLATIKRNALSQPTHFPAIDPIARLKEIESILIAIEQDLPCILVGPSGSGKSSLLAHVAALAGKPMVIFPLNADVDAMDLIGGFEQADPHREVQAALSRFRQALQDQILSTLPSMVARVALDVLTALGSSLTGEAHQYETLLPLIESLQVDPAVNQELATLLDQAKEALHKPLTLENPRFEWLDGVIVRAVETGAWLVLDNANLCSASVLDRLNSLLERPNGILSINEHSGPGGEPRIIKPHPDFRIFLTVDPRYGELSRAMRNRSVEIYLDVLPAGTSVVVERIAPVDGTLQRYHTAAKLASSQGTEEGQLIPLAFDAISLGDSSRLDAYISIIREALSDGSPSPVQSPDVLQHLDLLLSYIHHEDAGELRQAIAGLYTPSPDKMLMPLHPLINSPMMPLLDQAREGLTCWLAVCYELFIDIQKAEKAMAGQLSKVNVSKPSSLNRLQRSFVADKVASLAKDSTVNSVRFLASVAKAIKGYISTSTAEPGNWKQRRAILRRVVLFWKRTFSFLIASQFEEARFQSHLTQGANLLRRSLAMAGRDDEGIQKLLVSIEEFLERDFVVGFKLVTGLSMETMWRALRPDPIADQATLEQVMELERLADRFDEMRWRVDVDIATLRTVQDSMARIYAVVRTGKVDGASLVKDLQQEISALEAKIGVHSAAHEPFFASSFEGLRQVGVLHRISTGGRIGEGSGDVDVLSSLPTASLMRIQCMKGTGLQGVDCVLAQQGQGSEVVHPWEGELSKALLRRYEAAASASLGQLRSLEVEMPIMGRALAGASEALAADPLGKAEGLLVRLMGEVMSAHDPSRKGGVEVLFESLVKGARMGAVELGELGEWLEQSEQLQMMEGGDWPGHVVEVFRGHFAKALLALVAARKGLQPRSAFASIAWVRFALGCVTLFVPDKIFDPHHRAQIEAEEHQELYVGLQREIAALEAFEVAFTGQKTGIRLKALAEEAGGLGEPPAVQSIYRPGGGELRSLQGEFSNVLGALLANDVATTHLKSIMSSSTEVTEELSLVEQNVSLLIHRLTSRFGAYQDLTMPLVSFLRCLKMGLSLGRGVVPPATASEDNEDEDNKSEVLVSVTPFLQGTVYRAETEDLPLRNFAFLYFVQTVAAVEGKNQLPPSMRKQLFESLAFIHEVYSKKFEEDKRKEVEASGLSYVHKGSLEDEKEYDRQEFDSLFPDYQDEGDDDDHDKTKVRKPKKSKRSGKDLAVMLAEAHEKIFLGSQEPQVMIKELCTQVARTIARSKGGQTGPEMDAMLLPATLLVFEDSVKAFSASVETGDYNFYTDAHLAEVRKVLNLVNAIRNRFLELQGIDEIGHHQTLADVILACDKVLEMAIDDPLAKIITAIEKLHAHVYEWHEGGWATAANKAVALYEKLRDTICDWRRLELSSWSRLLDVEVKKTHDAAKAFWFDAYNDVILKSCVFLEEGLLKEYAVELLETLSTYFTGDRCTVGQFKARLGLLRQLKSQLDLLTRDEKEFGVVGEAVENSIRYYGRYLGKVEEYIKNGRQPLDRSMKDVLLMGKWRDKNIEALRASARKSHEKLFKLVRKFRAVLEQPVRVITDQGLPEEKYEGVVGGEMVVKKVEHSVDPKAIEVCREMVPGIEAHPQWSRMVNLPGVLKAMGRHGSLPAGVVGAAKTVDEYITDLVSSIAELRKETPSTLTDENKEAVRHLKTRKVTLFSETLKTLRAMGFSRNLGTNILDKQSSTQKVLVGSGLVPHLSGPELDALEYFYHKTLDLAPKVRKAANDHNEDLNREVVGRSVGFFEGVLHVMFKQRQFLSKTAHADQALEEAIAYVRQLSIAGEGSFAPETKQTNYAQVLKWLVQIVKFGVHLVDVHGKLGQIDNKPVESRLGAWVETFAKLEKTQLNLPQLPEGFVSMPQETLQVDVERELAALKTDLPVLAQERPDLAFVMEQINLWTDIQTTAEITNGPQHSGIDTFANSALTLTSKILVALQNFQKVASTLPATTEDPSWLVTYGEALQKSIDALRMPTITNDITSLISQLRSIPTPSVATPILRLVLPILQQYSASCLDNITQFTSLHRTLCRLGYTLSTSFTIISSQGFCTPSEPSNEKSNETGNVENDGTGLGDGEGAEDISKDIQPDEDLTELAQDKNNNTQGDIEEHDDAVDMGDDELEGELGDVAGKDEEEEDKDGSDDEGDDEDVDEQAGDVDDLDPTAVDEKMWDGSGEDEAEKDQQGEGEKGERDESDTVAAEEKKDDKKKKEEENKREGNEKGEEDKEGEDEEEEGEPGDENEGVAMEELNKQDQNVDEQETLALPEDMDVDISDGEEEEEDDLDGLSDVDPDKIDEEEKITGEDDADSDNGEEQEKGEEEHQKDEEIDEAGAEEEGKIDAAGEREEEMDVDEQGDEGREDEEEKPKPMQDDGGGVDQNDVAPSEVQNGGGQAQDDANDMEQDETENKAAQRESGAVSKQQAEQDKAPGAEGQLSTMDQEQGPSDQPEDDSKQAQPFKKLGDALERWYRNQKDIQAADDQERPEKQAEDMSKAEFQHLQDDTAEADAQALGTATDEEAKPMNDAMAIDNEMEEQGQQVLPEDEQPEEGGDVDMEDAEPAEPQDGIKNEREDGRSGVATHRGAPDNSKTPGDESAPNGAEDEDVQETSTQLSATHLTDEDRPLRPYDEALELWSTFQQKTQGLSQSLSSQLRLILAPTQSTKLSGSFRTGKRLNIKKIIPYIASSYKRDKIWMRRAIPSKRAYQILLCVDDSSSMSDENRSSSGRLALESLVMVARALTILESGQIGVLGFGEEVFTAHSLTSPSFSSGDTGARVLQNFTFQSAGTDMIKLMRGVIDQFRDARLMSQGGEDLWQLALILSDGLVQSRDHARLRPLLREATEQRVMVVFVVMDDVRDKKGHSVLELKEARFGADGVPVVRRYLDSFPFEYYLIVHNLEDLPGALAGVLRSWFQEVNA